MLNRVHRNPIDCDMLSIADREQYHATSLARLLFDCRDHPLVAGRINGKLALTSIGPGCQRITVRPFLVEIPTRIYPDRTRASALFSLLVAARDPSADS